MRRCLLTSTAAVVCLLALPLIAGAQTATAEADSQTNQGTTYAYSTGGGSGGPLGDASEASAEVQIPSMDCSVSCLDNWAPGDGIYSYSNNDPGEGAYATASFSDGATVESNTLPVGSIVVIGIEIDGSGSSGGDAPDSGSWSASFGGSATLGNINVGGDLSSGPLVAYTVAMVGSGIDLSGYASAGCGATAVSDGDPNAGGSASAEAGGSASVSILTQGDVYLDSLSGVSYGGGGIPTPNILSVAPFPLIAGQSGATLVVKGTGFAAGATVLWNGSALSTAYVSSNQLTAQVPGANLAKTGEFPITVSQPLAADQTINVASGPVNVTVTKVTPAAPTHIAPIR